MIRALLGVILIVVFSTGCEEAQYPPIADLPPGKVVFELDYQDGCDPFMRNGETEVVWRFPNCCKPEFLLDDTSIEDTLIVNTPAALKKFWSDNCIRNHIPPGLDTLPIYKYYLGGIRQFREINGDPVPDVAGRTHQDEIYKTYSVICRDVIDAGEPRTWRETHTVCHELGHQLAWLPHLAAGSCGEHTDGDSCLMGQYEWSECNYQTNLLTYVHFCDTCLVKLCQAEGIN
jgi:hypothetical protein